MSDQKQRKQRKRTYIKLPKPSIQELRNFVPELQNISLLREIEYAINHPIRLQILQFLKNENTPKHVKAIYIALRLEQSICSTNLGVLRKTQAVLVQKKGKFRLYSINQNMIDRIKEILPKIE